MSKNKIDYSKDEFQGSWHDLPPNASTGINTKKTKPEYYSVSKNNHQSIAMKKCLSCGENDLKSEYKYCPKCGLLFDNN